MGGGGGGGCWCGQVGQILGPFMIMRVRLNNIAPDLNLGIFYLFIFFWGGKGGREVGR